MRKRSGHLRSSSAGTGAIVINEISHGAITHVGIALTFGLIVLAMIYTLGDISAALIMDLSVRAGFGRGDRSARLPLRSGRRML